MKISRNLYIGNSMRAENIKRLLAEINCGKTVRNAVVITVSSNPDNQLDFIHTYFLRQESFRRMLPLVVGVASDRYEANVLLEVILKDTMDNTGGTDMRTYLLGRDLEGAEEIL